MSDHSPALPGPRPDASDARPVRGVAIVTDGSCDMPLAERESAGAPWLVVPERWVAADGDEVLDDGSDHRQLARRVLTGRGPEPVEPGFRELRAAYRSLAGAERVFSIHSPERVSRTVESAREAAGGCPNVRVVEAGAAGLGVGLLAVRAASLIAEGASADDVEAWLRRHHDAVHMLVLPDRFDPMRGQRMSAARLLAGRPVLATGDAGGLPGRGPRLRSRRAVVSAIEQGLARTVPQGTAALVAIGHADAAGAVDPFLDIIERARPRAQVVAVGRIGPRLVAQLGYRCVGAAWLVDAGVPTP